jgi:polysaccharide biosynthesis protein PslG
MRGRTGTERGVSVLGVTVFVCLLIAGFSQPAQADQLRGVQLSPNHAFSPAPSGQSAADDTSEISSACTLGAGVVREFVSWQQLEKDGPGQIDPGYVAKLDSLMQQAGSCGIKVIFDLLGTPQWDSVAPASPNFAAYPGVDGPSHYRQIVAWILARWPALYGLEVWNEPDLSNWWAGSAGQYADLVNAAVAAKRDTGAQTQILAGALARPGTAYLQSLYLAGMRGQDDVSIHPYSAICTPAGCQQYDPDPITSAFRTEIETIHAAMLANGDVGGLWLTEFGFATCPAQPACVSEDVQADWMVKSFQMAAAYPYVGGLTAFTLRDVPAPAGSESNWQYHFGLTNTDFSPKPAYAAVRTTLRNLSPAPAGAGPAPVGGGGGSTSGTGTITGVSAGFGVPTGQRAAALRRCKKKKRGPARRKCIRRADRVPV